MEFTASSTIGEILKEKPDAKEVLAKHLGQPIDESQLSMAMGMSVQGVAGYIGWDSEKVSAVIKDINEL